MGGGWRKKQVDFWKLTLLFLNLKVTTMPQWFLNVWELAEKGNEHLRPILSWSTLLSFFFALRSHLSQFLTHCTHQIHWLLLLGFYFSMPAARKPLDPGTIVITVVYTICILTVEVFSFWNWWIFWENTLPRVFRSWFPYSGLDGQRLCITTSWSFGQAQKQYSN